MKSVEIISVPVTDQQRSKEFYLKLGLQLLAEADFGTQKWIQLGLPDGGASLTLVDWFDKMPAGSMQALVIATDDIDKDVAELTEKGIQVGAIDTTPWGRFATIKDPDGNTLSLHQS
ncbi:MAG: glyoxalase [Sphingobacteriaceae bacterium]|jgi:predicted enzyme related to lactoylglutathione lyase|nr:glyoxalase [Sphingobacteriaceae bacterium]